MASLSIEPCSISGLHRITRSNFQDARGVFSRLFCGGELKLHGLSFSPEQVNFSHTLGEGTVRGLHFQYPPFAESKIVTCLQGQVFDLAVDLREESQTFLHWHGEVLSSHKLNSILIPQGFAHGFQVLSAEAHLLYLHTKAYQPKAEGRLHPKDPTLAISWPLEVNNLSANDAAAPFIDTNFRGLDVTELEFKS